MFSSVLAVVAAEVLAAVLVLAAALVVVLAAVLVVVVLAAVVVLALEPDEQATRANTMTSARSSAMIFFMYSILLKFIAAAVLQLPNDAFILHIFSVEK